MLPVTAYERQERHRARVAAVESRLVDTCRIEMPLVERDARGGVVETRYVTRPQPNLSDAEAVPCEFKSDPMAEALTETGGTYGNSGGLVDVSGDRWTLTVRVGTVIEDEDRVVKLSDASQYEVKTARTHATDPASYTATVVRVGTDQPGAGSE